MLSLRYIYLWLVLALLLATGCANAPRHNNQTTTLPPTVTVSQAGAWQQLAYTNEQGATMKYALFTPKNYDPQRKYPLILWFHGAGSRGTELSTLLNESDQHSIGYLARPDIQENFPAFVLAPQLLPGRGWVARRASQDGSDLANALAIFDLARRQNSVDNARLYVMGSSMGGFAAWYVLAQRPDVFAAGVPICGGGDEVNAAKLVNTPVWAFHGDQDEIVSVEFSRRMVNALKQAGGQPKYTEYPNVGHHSWENAFQEKDLLPWLFAQKRGG